MSASMGAESTWRCGNCGEALDLSGISVRSVREFGKLATYVETKCCAAWPVDEDGEDVCDEVIDEITSMERGARYGF